MLGRQQSISTYLVDVTEYRLLRGTCHSKDIFYLMDQISLPCDYNVFLEAWLPLVVSDDLDELKVNPREESSLIIGGMLSDLRFYGTVEQKGEIPECLILVDKLRLEQVIDNIAGNSFKYAGTPLEVEFASDKDSIRVILSDQVLPRHRCR